ncbi:MAG TPA: dihydrolipoamide acetyltransferase family protein [Flavipsychrobacter sp.]|nr:dihydrolipoamide acetyltransferase family protein [Flavipsychrobacter sp.]
MAIVDLVMPKMGESIMEATVLKWHKKPGDKVKMDETVLEIATDKVDSEVPSTAEGVITEILFKENDVVPVGTVIAKVDTVGTGAQATPQSAPVNIQQAPKPAVQQQAQQNIPAASVQAAPSGVGEGNRFYSPLVLNIAGKEGISMTELENIPGTGNEGRVTKKDILNYVSNKQNGSGAGSQHPAPAYQEEESQVQPQIESQPIAQQQAAPQPTVVTRSEQPVSGNVEIIEMDRMRKLIAEHMVRSKATSPHVTSFTEADVTNIVRWRDKVKGEFDKKYGEKITFTPIFIEAIVKCIRKYPMINCSVDGDRIIVKKDINIGMAAALPSGNLIVPVIKNADTKNLLGLTKDVNSLANNARNNKLKADDTQGGTFTLTNVGTFGSLMGTPIINQPQVAILAVGSIKKRPMVMETEDGDVIAIRHMMYLSMSYDHRVVDGSLGASFLTAVAKELEAFDPGRSV